MDTSIKGFVKSILYSDLQTFKMMSVTLDISYRQLKTTHNTTAYFPSMPLMSLLGDRSSYSRPRVDGRFGYPIVIIGTQDLASPFKAVTVRSI